MSLQVWKLFAAFAPALEPFVRGVRAVAADPADQPLVDAFAGLIESGVALRAWPHTAKFVREEVIPLIDLGTAGVSDREEWKLGRAGPTIAFVRELKRRAVPWRDPETMSTMARSDFVGEAIEYLIDRHPAWVEGLVAEVESFAVPDESPPETCFEVYATTASRSVVGRLARWRADDDDGPGGNWIAFAPDRSVLFRSYRREPRYPGCDRVPRLRVGEQTMLDHIVEDVESDGPREVYADWLTERGDPRGELILLQLLRERAGPTPAAVAREAELFDRMRIELGIHGDWKLEYRRGFVERARFDSNLDAIGEDQAFWTYLAEAEPGMVRALDVTMGPYISFVIEALQRTPWPNLTELRLVQRRDWTGDFQIRPHEARRLCQMMPRLRTLVLEGNRLFPVLEHPGLVTLKLSGMNTIAGCGLEAPAGCDGPRLPSLVGLELAMGRAIPTSALALDAGRMHALRWLSIFGVGSRDGDDEDADEDDGSTMLSWLAAWEGTPRLARVAFSTIDERDAPHLEGAARALASLEAIAVGEVRGSAEFRAAVHAALPQLTSG